MKRTALISVLIAATTLAHSSITMSQGKELSNRAKAMDTNKDGLVQEGEAQGMLKSNFKDMDCDKNGGLDGAEISGFFTGAECPKAAAPKKKSKFPPLSDRAKAMDTNKDGLVQKNEAKAILFSNFKAMDCDKNKGLDGAEISGFFTGAGCPKSATEEPLFRVTLLGTGAPPPRVKRFGPSTLIETDAGGFVFDAGRGATIRIFQLGGEHPLRARPYFARADKLFLTHLHSDHVAGIPDLWLSGRMFGRLTPFQVWGPPGTKSLMTNLEAAYAEDIRVRHKAKKEANKIIARDVYPGEVYNKNGVSIRAFLVDHQPFKYAFGFRIDYAGRAVVLSGDTKYCQCVIDAAKGADLVIHEVAAVSEQFKKQIPFFATFEDNHVTPERVGKVFAAVKPKLGVFTHLVTYGVSPDKIIERARKTYSGKMVVGKDLMRISVGKVVRVLDK